MTINKWLRTIESWNKENPEVTLATYYYLYCIREQNQNFIRNRSKADKKGFRLRKPSKLSFVVIGKIHSARWDLTEEILHNLYFYLWRRCSKRQFCRVVFASPRCKIQLDLLHAPRKSLPKTEKYTARVIYERYHASPARSKLVCWF